MSFRIEEWELPVAGLRRAVLEQIGRAEEKLSPRELEGDPAKAVHEARKAIKRARSGLRLGRAAFGRKAVRAELSALRDAAGRLSSARDAEVARALLRDVAAQGVGRLPAASWQHFEQALDGRAETDGPGPALTRHAELASEELAAVRGRIEVWSPDGEGGFAPVLAGLARGQKRGQRALRAALRGNDPDVRHELRKRVKDTWYQIELLGGLWPAVLDAQADEAHRLSGLLGDEHDLTVLAGLLERIEGVPDDPAPALELIAHRREELWAEALPLAGRLYAEKPKALVARLEAYGKASRSGSTSSSAGTGSPTTLV